LADDPCPRVSVILPAFNADRWLGDAIESVLAQTFADFELLALDDGSADETLAVIQRYATLDARVVPVALEHRGLVPTLNEGISRAKAGYIARLDADDICLPERFARQVAFLDANPDYVLVGSRVLRIDEDGVPVSRSMSVPLSHDSLVDRVQTVNCGISHPTVMARKEAIVAAGCYFENQFPAEDRGLWRRMLANGGKMENLPEGLVLKRRHANAVTVQNAMRKGVSMARIHRKMAVNAVSQGFMPAARKHAWAAWKADWRSPRRFAWAVAIGAYATGALVTRRGLAPELAVVRQVPLSEPE
jgi:glycosyltransferase involved in cell wall biosynthesis